MTYRFQNLISSPTAIRFVFFLGRVLPARLGALVADRIADQISRHTEADLVRAVRANQWVARGETLGKEALDRVVQETFRNTARTVYTLYHNIENPLATSRLIVLDANTEQLIQRKGFASHGLVVAGVHLSNFGLALQWFSTQKVKPLVLTIPNPQGGDRVEFEMRKKTGMNLIPASASTLRQSIRHLQEGGVVVTGVDRAIPCPQTRPTFFGRPAALPLHHILLARKAQVPMVVTATRLLPDGKYYVYSSEPVELDELPDRSQAERQNAEKVLRIAEGYIREAPQQWSVTMPVWPEALALAP
jgi:phosphatidylinositol dimannoside acyltransferase